MRSPPPPIGSGGAFVLTLRFLIRQLSKLGLAPDRALDSSPSGLTHALGRPATALNPAYPFDARTQRASSLQAPTFRQNRNISVYFSGCPNWGTAQNRFNPCYNYCLRNQGAPQITNFLTYAWLVGPPGRRRRRNSPPLSMTVITVVTNCIHELSTRGPK